MRLYGIGISILTGRYVPGRYVGLRRLFRDAQHEPEEVPATQAADALSATRWRENSRVGVPGDKRLPCMREYTPE